MNGMDTVAAVLPLAFVMIAGPQIISSFFLATSSHAVKNSVSYLAGAALSITTVVTVAFLFAQGTSGGGGGSHGTADTVIDWVILGLVLFLIVHTFLTRRTSQPPSWMGRLQEASPKLAFMLGLALLGVFPTDIAGSITVGLHVGRHGETWWQVLPFVAATLLLLGLPLLGILVLGRRAEVVLPKVRDWMRDNAWVVSEVVLVFFAVIAIDSLRGG
jgi:hypothetical protein